MTLIAMLVLADPVAISVGSQIKFVKTPSGWTQPGKFMDGKELSWLKLGSKETPRKYKVEWSEGPPMENTQFVTSEVVTEDEVFVSGGKFKAIKTTRLSPKSATYLKIAADYAKKKGAKAKNIVIQDIVSGDFNRDGQTDVLISIGTGSTSETLTKGDFSAAFLRTQIGKTVKTIDLEWETNFGQM
ncbi:MAG: hypothetical protein K8R88_15445, partial [Armatimonadetes bacterium]|nr:hypothetical protein [Armatimonadota bacterium]